MSRSCCKHPYNYNTCFQTKKTWKRDYNRLMRRVNKYNLKKNYENEDIIFFNIDEIADVWNGPADGVAKYAPYRPYRHSCWMGGWYHITKIEWFKNVMAK